MNTMIDPTSEVLSFRLGKEEYAISILTVQEIRGYEHPTQIPQASAFIKGVANLRGQIVPIVDMRLLFGLVEPTYNELTVVIVLKIQHHVIGIVVDSVADVVTLTPEQVRPAPDMASSHAVDCITGLGTIDERMLIMLDIERLMGSDRVGLITHLKQVA